MEALSDLPDGTVVYRELVGLDDSGRPDFNLLQSLCHEVSRIHPLFCKDRDLTRLPLIVVEEYAGEVLGDSGNGKRR
jgi:hypothetical protein